MKFKQSKLSSLDLIKDFLYQKTLDLSLHSGVEVDYHLAYDGYAPFIYLREVQFSIDGMEEKLDSLEEVNQILKNKSFL